MFGLFKQKIRKKVIFITPNQIVDMINNLKKLQRLCDDPKEKNRFININFLIDKEWLTVLSVDRGNEKKGE